MGVVGAHYLPLITLYGMWQFGILAIVLVGLGIAIGIYLPLSFTSGGWIGSAIFLLAAFPFKSIATRLVK